MSKQDSLPQRLNEEVKLFFGCSYTELKYSMIISVIMAAGLIPLYMAGLSLFCSAVFSKALILSILSMPILFKIISSKLGRVISDRHKGYLIEYIHKQIPVANRNIYFDLDGTISNKRYL